MQTVHIIASVSLLLGIPLSFAPFQVALPFFAVIIILTLAASILVRSVRGYAVTVLAAGLLLIAALVSVMAVHVDDLKGIVISLLGLLCSASLLHAQLGLSFRRVLWVFGLVLASIVGAGCLPLSSALPLVCGALMFLLGSALDESPAPTRTNEH